MGEAAFDELQAALQRDAGWSDEQVDVVEHYDEGVETIEAFTAVVLESFEEQLGMAFNLEKSSALRHD